MNFSRDSLCFIYFEVIIRQRRKKKFKLVELFLSRANEVKICGLVQQLILRMSRDLILQSRNSHSLNGDPPLKTSLFSKLQLRSSFGFLKYPRYSVEENLKGRIRCEIFLSRHFMKY